MKSEKSIDEEVGKVQADFRSIAVRVTLENITSRTKIPKSADVKVLEVLEKGMVLEFQHGHCQKGHQMLLNLTIGIPKGATEEEVIKFSTSAKTIEYGMNEESGAGRAVLDFIQFDGDGWQKILTIFAERQKQIAEFLSGARGY
ncbi:hypothetical protein K2X30_07200 [bacterium]|jgi:hypothetical protein|nr:hypothetical protein [bacterium]